MINKYLLGAGLGVLFLIGIGACGTAKADPIIDQVYAPAYRLQMEDGLCSAQLIKSFRDEKSGKVNTYALTAKHCVMSDLDGTHYRIVKDSHDDTLKPTGETVYDVTLFGKSYKSDLALLKLTDEDKLFESVAKVAPKDTKLVYGQDVVVVGYPLGKSMTQTEGKLGYKELQPAFKDISQSQMFYRATPDVVGGSSGSAMYTLVGGEYEIIGVITGGYQIGTFVNYFTPLDEIQDYLDTALPKSDAEQKAAEAKAKEDTSSGVVKKSETIKVYQ